MRIAFDIDGVMNYIEKFQLEHGIPWFRERGIEVKNLHGFDIKDIFGCSDELRREFWKSTVKGGVPIKDALIFELARNSEMRPGFPELLKQLDDNADKVYIITERYGTNKTGPIGAYNRSLVYNWLSNNGFNIPKENIIFVPEGKTKKDIYKEENIDIILEDKVENIKAIEEIDDLYAIIFNASYNRDYSNEKATRVDLPVEVFEKVKRIEEIKKEKEKQAKIVRPNQFSAQTGVPSVDRVWRQYYTEEEENLQIPEEKMIDHLRKKAEKWPNAIILEDDFGHKYTFDYFLNTLVPQYAKAFKNYGVQPGEPVVIALPNVVATQAAKFALNEIGAIPVMANPLSNEKEFTNYLTLNVDGKKPRVMLMFNRSLETVKKSLEDPEVELEHIVNIGVNSDFNFPYNLGYKITQSKFDPSKEDYKDISIISEFKDFLKGAENIKSYEKTLYKKNDCAVIYFTGGTTGNEKAVVCTNENVIAIAEQFNILIKNGEINDVTVNAMPWFHVFGDNQIFYFAACKGMTNYSIPKFNKNDVDKMFKRDIVNYNGVPAFLNATYANLSDIERYKNVKYMISGGAALSYASQVAINKALKRSGSKAVVEVGYGITEGSGGVSYTLVGADEAGCIGIPTPGTNMKIVKPGTTEELGYNQDGEICFSGPSVMKAYLNNEKETQRCLKVHQDGKVWFHSGDMGYVKENGLFYFSDRIKRMIIVSGENVYPNRIEKEIIDHHGDVVEDCFVISKTDNYRGEVPYIKIKLKEGIEPTEKIKEEIMNTCKNNFNNKHYWPTGLDFIKSIPLTKMSKADFKKLDDPNLIVDTTDKKETKEEILRRDYANNKFYRNFSKIYSPIYTEAPLYGRNVEYIGKENIPTKGSGIIAMNHLHAQDQNPILASVDRIVSLPAKKEYFDKPVARYFLEKMSMIPVDRYGDAIQAKNIAIGLLNTAPFEDFESEQVVIKDTIRYIESLDVKKVSKPSEIVKAAVQYLNNSYVKNNSDFAIKTNIDRIMHMPVSGKENGYGRALIASEEIVKKLKNNQLVAVFPEGTRNKEFYETGELYPFHDGAAYWARDTYSPIIPTAVTGEHKAGGDLLVRSGEAITVDPDLSNSDLKDVTNDLRDRVYELVIENLIQQDNPNNTKALLNIINKLQSSDASKDKDLLLKISSELKKYSSERNDEIHRKL